MSHDRVIREASRKQTVAFSFSKTYPAYIVLVFALIASVAIWRIVIDKVESDKTAAFDKATASVVSRLNTAANNHMQIIHSMKGLYQSFPFVVRDVFELYGSIPVKTFPSLQAVSFTQAIPAAELGSFIYFAQTERYYTYSVTPRNDTFSVYYPVFYTVPLERNETLVGYNLAANPIAMATLQRAVQRKDYTASPVLTLPNTDKQSFLLVVPVEKQDSVAVGVRGDEVSGILFVQILADEFFRTALGAGVASDTSIVFSCVDTTGGATATIFSSANSASIDAGSYTPAYTENVAVPIADRAFIVQFATVPGFGGGFQNNLPILSLLGGLVSSLLLFAFTMSILTSRTRAQDLAERMTRSQRRIVDTSRDMIGIIGLDSEIRAMNPAAFGVLGYTADEMIGKSIYDFIVPEDRERAIEKLRTAGDEQQIDYEVRMLAKNGQVRWVSWNDTVSRTDGLVYSIGRDVTERKIAEQEIQLKTKQIDLSRQYASESARFKSDFMSNASFYFRTSLTGIIGYLQLVLSKMYSSPEERDNYIETAYASAEDLLSRVGDILDVAEGDSQENNAAIESLPLERTVSDILTGFVGSNGHKRHVELTSDNADGYLVYSDRTMLKRVMSDVLDALSNGQGGTITASLQVNPYENVVDIQMLTPPNHRVAELIELARNAMTQEAQLESLARDHDDVIFRITTAMSRARMLKGRMAIDTLGHEGNVVTLTLPVKKGAAHKKR